MNRLDYIAHTLTWAGLARHWAGVHGTTDGLEGREGGLWETAEGELLDAEEAFGLMSDDLPEDVWHTDFAAKTRIVTSEDMDGTNRQIDAAVVTVADYFTVTFDGSHAKIEGPGQMRTVDDEICIGDYLMGQAARS